MDILTKYGRLEGIVSADYYDDGAVKDCILERENVLNTVCGDLIPQYGEENVRKKYIKSVSFFNGGELKSVSLEQQSDVITPIGEFPAELVTFYESGELKRIFPLNGKISGYWSEEDEAGLNIPFSFSFDFGEFTVKLIGICFYKSGNIRSLTLYPKETVSISTSIGEVSVRIGFSLYESGKIKALEPHQPTAVKTPIGVFNAYDINANGINADSCSLHFTEDGRIKSLITSTDKIALYNNSGEIKFITPLQIPNPLDENEIATISVKVDFDGENVTFTNDKAQTFKISEYKFTIVKGGLSCSSGCTDCSSCNLCGH